MRHFLFMLIGAKHLTINWSHLMCYVAGALWAWVEPTIPFAALCTFAVLVDCLSAWRLNRRVRKKYGAKAADGKLKSRHMSKMVGDLFMLFSVMLMAQGVDTYVVTAFDLPLSDIVAAIFLLYTIVSVLENESSCNTNKWALIVQRYVVDKTMRHLDIRLKDVHTSEFPEAAIVPDRAYTDIVPPEGTSADESTNNGPTDPTII